MRILRTALRLLILLSMIVLVPICLILVFGSAIVGRRARYRFVMAATQPWCRIWLAAFGVQLCFDGKRDPRAQIFVGNHVSYMDIFVAGAATGGVFVSRHDVKDWPLIGWFARMAGTVFIDRSSLRSAIESSKGVVERVEQGARITLFPEGGVLPGEGVKPFKPFLLAAIADAGLAVQPLTINYTHIDERPFDESNRLLIEWHDTSIVTHGWRIMQMRSVRVVVAFSPVMSHGGAQGADGTREFAESLRREVSARSLFVRA